MHVEVMMLTRWMMLMGLVTFVAACGPAMPVCTPACSVGYECADVSGKGSMCVPEGTSALGGRTPEERVDAQLDLEAKRAKERQKMWCDCYADEHYGGDRAKCEEDFGASSLELMGCNYEVSACYVDSFFEWRTCSNETHERMVSCMAGCPADQKALGDCFGIAVDKVKECLGLLPEGFTRALSSCQRQDSYVCPPPPDPNAPTPSKSLVEQIEERLVGQGLFGTAYHYASGPGTDLECEYASACMKVNIELFDDGTAYLDKGGPRCKRCRARYDLYGNYVGGGSKFFTTCTTGTWRREGDVIEVWPCGEVLTKYPEMKYDISLAPDGRLEIHDLNRAGATLVAFENNPNAGTRARSLCLNGTYCGRP